MAGFIVRRLMVSLFVLLAATFIMYVLTALSGDPLEDLRNQPPNVREAMVEARVEHMNLDQPIPVRYVSWLAGLLRGDLGVTRENQAVSALLTDALSATLQLVVVATLLAISIGILVGIVSALRQYSGFDYGVTFSAFVFFSLPVFWVATMLKQYVAIDFNNWLADPVIPATVIGIASVFAGLVWFSIMTGPFKRRAVAFAAGVAVTGIVLSYLSVTRWFADPGLGFAFILVVSVVSAVAVTTIFSGLRSGGPMFAAVGAAVIGSVLYPALDGVLVDPTWPLLFGLALVTIAACTGLGLAFGGLERRTAVLVSIVSGLITAGLIFVDHLLQAFAQYSENLFGRPIATVGARTPNFQGDFWTVALDSTTHLMLPTMALILISLATYTRYTRASMLEVLNQDYVRTARAKGLSERLVISKHAFRNALIPVTTLMAFDFGGVISGAVITETVFAWKGMGSLFIKGLNEVDPAPVMAFFLVTGGAVVTFNMLADIAYAYLDPRIRLT